MTRIRRSCRSPRTRRRCARSPRRPGRSSPPGCRARRTWPRRSSRAWPAASRRPPRRTRPRPGARGRLAPAATSSTVTGQRGEHRPHELGRLLFVAVRREPVVHRDRARVGHDVPRNAAADGHGVQALVIPQPVDLRLSRGVRAQYVKDGARLVDRVAPHPGARGVRPLPGRGDLGPQRPLAPASISPELGSIRTAKSPASSSGAAAAQPSSPFARPRPPRRRRTRT